MRDHMGYADSHLHITDPMFEGVELGASLLFACTASPKEWDALSAIKSDGIVKFYGIHPWYPEDALDRLEAILKNDKMAHVGEIGLDSKRGPPIDEQIELFEAQLELAERYKRVANIHMIGCESEMLKILRRHKTVCILHSFSGPESYVKPFAECGCYFSISPRIHNKSEEKIKALMDAIPSHRLLVETDAPFSPLGMDEHIQRLSKIMGIDPYQLERITYVNAWNIIP